MICTGCDRDLPAHCFSPQRRRCHDCRNAYARERRAQGHTYTTAQRRKWQWRYKYGIEPEDCGQMVADQGGVCAICGSAPDQGPLCVDHDHRTGRIRGLLCHQHNQMLGLAQDDPARLRAAADYLEQHGASK